MPEVYEETQMSQFRLRKLPPEGEIETKAILKQAAQTHRRKISGHPRRRWIFNEGKNGQFQFLYQSTII